MQIYPPLKFALLALAILLISGCAGQKPFMTTPESPEKNPFIRIASDTPDDSPDLDKPLSDRQPKDAPVEPATPPKPEPPDTKRKTASPFGDFISAAKKGAKPSERPPETASSDNKVHVELAFDNADLYEVLDLAFFEMYGISYMIDPTLKANVTFHISGDYTRQEFIDLFNDILQLNSLAVVKGPGSIYKIVQKAGSPGAGNTGLAPEDQPPMAPGDITQLIRLRYASAPMAAASIAPFLSRGAVTVQDNLNNALIVTDTADNIDKVVGILGVLDVPFFKDTSWKLFPVKSVDASDLAKDLSQVLKSGGLYSRPGVNPGSFEVIPVVTMNALLVVSRWPEILDLVAEWIAAMDQVPSTGSQVFVYFVENGTAAELADILSQLYGGSAKSSRTSRTSSRTSRTSRTTTGAKPSTTRATVPQTAAAAVSVSPGGDIIGDVEIIADESNNAIVIRAMERDYRIIEKVLKQLDILPRQVLINVVIAEITLSGSVEYGVEWFLNKNIGGIGSEDGDYTAQGALDGGISRPYATPLGSTSGFFFSVYDPVKFLRGLVKAVGSDSDVNILSSPNILALDNQEAMIEVGNEIPTVTGSTSDAVSGTTVTSTVQYRKTGIILSVTPHINSSGLVKMDVDQEVSEVGEFVTELNNYTFLTRKVATSLVVEDGRTIVIGGLMKSTGRSGNAGIPFLKDIPILGLLFGSTNQSIEKTELVLLITPTVIKTKGEAERITEEFSGKIKRLMEQLQN
ncbi:MAG: type II secretion system secretin GspD [Desulfatirhabdiaceae bacterium]